MRIAIDASRTTVARRTGTENYALQLIRALLKANAGRANHAITLYFRDQPPTGLFEESAAVTERVIPIPRLWTHVGFAAALWADRPDVTFVPAHTLPYLFPGRGVVTIHDLGYRFFPTAHPPSELRYLDATTRYSARRAARILADSRATQRDLTEQYGVDPAKIRVVYPGVEGLQRADQAHIAAVRRKYGIPGDYLLFLGTLQPRKNLGRLIDAFLSCNLTGFSLVLAGKRGWLFEEAIPALRLDQRSRVIIPGYVADDDIAALYSGATAFTFPSLYEGFGFPVLEAMRCGTPVLCSTTSSLPELAGDAALLVDPLDQDAIAAGIARLVSHPALRADLVTRGYQQTQRFTWARAAQETLEALTVL
ncbi:MAG TPA: glycosyltransferase family 1 protein [Aggregatilineales bacterium]|nr:glycosyltransferase family 1 protein [Aggregatilineales bacterium]